MTKQRRARARPRRLPRWLLLLACAGALGCGDDDDLGGTSGASGGLPEGDGAPYPIVFLHGMGGFVSSGSGPFQLAYFAGVFADLETIGEREVYATLASPYASSSERARQIAPQIDSILQRTGKRKVNLVAHSQGGLDARVLASPNGLGYGDRIASITTFATPHRGTPVADLALAALGAPDPSFVDPAAEALVELLGWSLYDLPEDDEPSLRAQLIDLSEANARAFFNPTYLDDARVRYESYAGRTNLRLGRAECAGSVLPNGNALDLTAAPLQASATAIEGNPFAPLVNDGLVPVASARYGTFVRCVAADHLDEVGQPVLAGLAIRSFDHLAFYRAVVARLRASAL